MDDNYISYLTVYMDVVMCLCGGSGADLVIPGQRRGPWIKWICK